MKKLLALLLALVMVLAFAACGGKAKNDNPYDLDYESTQLQPMSDERADKETLAKVANEYFQGLMVFEGSDLEKLTYDDVVEQIGVDPSAYQYEAVNGRGIYFWFVDDNKGPWLSVYVNEDGTLFGSGSANLG